MSLFSPYSAVRLDLGQLFGGGNQQNNNNQNDPLGGLINGILQNTEVNVGVNDQGQLEFGVNPVNNNGGNNGGNFGIPGFGGGGVVQPTTTTTTTTTTRRTTTTTQSSKYFSFSK